MRRDVGGDSSLHGQIAFVDGGCSLETCKVVDAVDELGGLKDAEAVEIDAPFDILCYLLVCACVADGGGEYLVKIEVVEGRDAAT